jgi:hypothetical protein
MNDLDRYQQAFSAFRVIDTGQGSTLTTQNKSPQLQQMGVYSLLPLQGNVSFELNLLHPAAASVVNRQTNLEPTQFSRSRSSTINALPVILRTTDYRLREQRRGHDFDMEDSMDIMENCVAALSRAMDKAWLRTIFQKQTVRTEEASYEVSAMDQNIKLFKAYPDSTDTEAAQVSYSTMLSISNILKSQSTELAGQSGVSAKMPVPPITESILAAANINALNTVPDYFTKAGGAYPVYGGIHIVPLSSKFDYDHMNVHKMTDLYFPVVYNEDGSPKVSDNGSTIIQTLAIVNSGAAGAYIRVDPTNVTGNDFYTGDGAIRMSYEFGSIMLNQADVYLGHAEIGGLRIAPELMVLVQLESGYDIDGNDISHDIINAASVQSLSGVRKVQIATGNPTGAPYEYSATVINGVGDLVQTLSPVPKGSQLAVDGLPNEEDPKSVYDDNTQVKIVERKYDPLRKKFHIDVNKNASPELLERKAAELAQAAKKLKEAQGKSKNKNKKEQA